MGRVAALIAALALLCAPQLALAQAATSKVVSACGAPTYGVGTKQYPTMGPNGQACGGAAPSAQSGTTQRTLTATNLTLNTNTTICPAATGVIATEIYFTTTGVGVGLNGQTLTAAAPGATSTNSPDFAITVAGTFYTSPPGVGITNAITAYGAAGVIRCIQTKQ